MNHWQYLPFLMLAVPVLLLMIRSAARKHRERRQRDFTRTLETVLQPKETVKLVCPQKKGNCTLTSRRLLFETREGFTAVPLNTIKRIQGRTKDGKSTTVAEKMVSLTVKAEKEHTIYPGENFPELYKALKKKTEKKKPNKKA